MRTYYPLTWIFLLLMLSNFSLAAPGPQPIRSLLPDTDNLDGWTASGAIETVKGEDLFLLIDGGAEIYHEYGFEEALTGEFKKGKRTINLEIYQMKNPAAAFGVYSFKTGGGSEADGFKELPIGNGALLEDYYLNAWKGSYVVTLTGFDAEPETLEGLKLLANLITRKIETTGKRPGIIDLLLPSGLRQTGIKYLKGGLALFNQYIFANKNIFGVEEGVLGTYEGYRIFIFRYDNPAKSLEWFQHAAGYLAKSDKFKDFNKQKKGAFSMSDKDGYLFHVQQVKSYIFIIQYKPSVAVEPLIAKMTSSLGK